jgi:UDP-glucose 4-epimerase
MKILITGGAGFLGSLLAEELAVMDHDIVVVDNLMYGAEENVPKMSNVIFVKKDIRQQDTWNYLKMYGNFDIVYHFAAPSSITLFKQDLAGCLDDTITTFIHALNFCAKTGARLVYPSTGSLYAGVDGEQTENAEIDLSRLNEYAKGKWALENIQLAYQDVVEILGLRIFATFGEREEHKGDFASVVYMFAKQILNGEKPVIWGDGKQKRDFIYQDDVISTIIDLSMREHEGIYNIGSGTNVSFNDVIKAISDVLEKEVEVEYVDKPQNYLETTKADTTLLRYAFDSHDLEWQAGSFKDGVAKMLEAMK